MKTTQWRLKLRNADSIEQKFHARNKYKVEIHHFDKRMNEHRKSRLEKWKKERIT